MTHEDFNSFQMVDKPMSRFFRSIKKYLDNTILIFAGDHGPRFNGHLETVMGRLEERMPFVSIRIPDSLNSKHPHLRKFTDLNTDRLVTWYDIHQVLLDTAKGHFSSKSEGNATPETKVGPVSVWRKLVPLSRTCENADIPEMFCVCAGSVHLDPTSWEADEAGVALVKYATKLMKQNILREECVRQTFNETVAAEYILPHKLVYGNRTDNEFENYSDERKDLMIEKIKVKVRALPSNALIEAHLIRNRKNDKNHWFVFTNHLDDVQKVIFDQNMVKQLCK